MDNIPTYFIIDIRRKQCSSLRLYITPVKMCSMPIYDYDEMHKGYNPRVAFIEYTEIDITLFLSLFIVVTSKCHVQGGIYIPFNKKDKHRVNYGK